MSVKLIKIKAKYWKTLTMGADNKGAKTVKIIIYGCKIK